MNKAELIASVAKEAGLTKKAVGEVIDGLTAVVRGTVAAGEEVRLSGLFNLSVVKKPASTGRNPRTGESVAIAAKNAVKIKPAKELSDAANGK